MIHIYQTSLTCIMLNIAGSGIIRSLNVQGSDITSGFFLEKAVLVALWHSSKANLHRRRKGEQEATSGPSSGEYPEVTALLLPWHSAWHRYSSGSALVTPLAELVLLFLLI